MSASTSPIPYFLRLKLQIVSTWFDSLHAISKRRLSNKGCSPRLDSVKILRKSVELGIPCLTSLDTAKTLATILAMNYTPQKTSLIDICTLIISRNTSYKVCRRFRNSFRQPLCPILRDNSYIFVQLRL